MQATEDPPSGGSAKNRDAEAKGDANAEVNLLSLMGTHSPEVMREHVAPFLIPQDTSSLLSTDRLLAGNSAGTWRRLYALLASDGQGGEGDELLGRRESSVAFWKGRFRKEYYLAKDYHGGLIEAFFPNETGIGEEVTVVQAMDDETFVIASLHGEMKAWNASTGDCVSAFQCLDGAWMDTVFDLVRLDDDRLISCSAGGGVKLWDVRTGRCLRTYRTRSDCYAFAIKTTDDSFVTVDAEGTAELWHADSPACVRTLAQGDACTGMIVQWSCRMSENTYATSDGSSFTLWDAKTGECIRSVMVSEFDEGIALLLKVDDTKLLSFTMRGDVKVWDTCNGTCVKRYDLPFQTSGIASSLSPRLVLSSEYESKKIHLWDWKDGKILHTFESENYVSIGRLNEAAFVTGHADGGVQIWKIPRHLD